MSKVPRGASLSFSISVKLGLPSRLSLAGDLGPIAALTVSASLDRSIDGAGHRSKHPGHTRANLPDDDCSGLASAWLTAVLNRGAGSGRLQALTSALCGAPCLHRETCAARLGSLISAVFCVRSSRSRRSRSSQSSQSSQGSSSSQSSGEFLEFELALKI